MLKRILMAAGIPLALAVAACSSSEAQDADQAAAEPPRLSNVAVETVRPTSLSEYIMLPAASEAIHDVVISSEQGGKLLELHADRGDYVRRGSVLAKVGTDIYEAQLKEAEANLRIRAAELEKAKALYGRGSISEMSLLRNQVDHDAAEARVELAATQFERSILRAPFDGRIDGRYVDEGEMVAPGGQVFRIVDSSRMKLKSELAERDVTFVEGGISAEVHFDAFPDTTFSARLSFVAATADPGSRTYPCEFLLDNTHRMIRGGMHARIKVLKAKYNGVIVLPQTALVETEDGRNVFVLDGDRAVRRDVRVGASSEGMVVVSDGVKPDEQVIITGQRDLVDGQQVRVTGGKD